MKRWLVAGAALAVGGMVSAALLFLADPARGAVQVYVATRDVAADGVMGADSIELEQVTVGASALLYTRGQEAELVGRRAAHELVAGQLIQRSDLLAPNAVDDRRVVFVPLKDVPPVAAGARVDLLVFGGSASQPDVSPFALGVEVRGEAPGGLLIVVPSSQAAAFVYAGATMHLAAVVADPGSAPGAEAPIATPDQARAAVARR